MPEGLTPDQAAFWAAFLASPAAPPDADGKVLRGMTTTNPIDKCLAESGVPLDDEQRRALAEISESPNTLLV